MLGMKIKELRLSLDLLWPSRWVAVPLIKIGNSRFGDGEINKFSFRLTVFDMLWDIQEEMSNRMLGVQGGS